jgi:hypothetical protein
MTAPGVMAQFPTADALVDAARRARGAGYRRLEAYSPFPIAELEETLELPPTRLRVGMFWSAVIGAALGYGMEHLTAVFDYPINSGGRPALSWPAFIPVTFEVAVLFAAIGGFIYLLASVGLARLNHPVFDVHGFESASQDRFFLVIEADDEPFDVEAASAFLARLRPLGISPVAGEPA